MSLMTSLLKLPYTVTAGRDLHGVGGANEMGGTNWYAEIHGEDAAKNPVPKDVCSFSVISDTGKIDGHDAAVVRVTDTDSSANLEVRVSRDESGQGTLAIRNPADEVTRTEIQFALGDLSNTDPAFFTGHEGNMDFVLLGGAGTSQVFAGRAGGEGAFQLGADGHPYAVQNGTIFQQS